MYATLLLVVSLSAIPASGPADSGYSLPPSEIHQTDDGYDDSGVMPQGPVVVGSGCWLGCGQCLICGQRQHFGRCHCNCPLRSTCDMYPHVPYFPEYFGYYYFHPYNYRSMLEHQEIVLRWGGDPRNPYSHDLFDKLYADAAVEAPSPYDPNWKGRLPRSQKLPNLQRLLVKGVEQTPEN